MAKIIVTIFTVLLTSSKVYASEYTVNVNLLYTYMQTYENAVKLNDVNSACWNAELATIVLVRMQHQPVPQGQPKDYWQGFYKFMKSNSEKICKLKR